MPVRRKWEKERLEAREQLGRGKQSGRSGRAWPREEDASGWRWPAERELEVERSGLPFLFGRGHGRERSESPQEQEAHMS